MYSQSVRSTGDNLDLQLASEMGVGEWLLLKQISPGLVAIQTYYIGLLMAQIINGLLWLRLLIMSVVR